MAILAELNAEVNPDRFVSRHYLHTHTADGLELVMFSGNALIGVKGTSSDQWLRGQIRLDFPIGPDILPRGGNFRSVNWIVMMWPNSVYNQGESIDSGFAIDDFWLTAPSPTSGPIDEVEIWADVAVRDSDAYLYRVGYHVTLLGEFV